MSGNIEEVGARFVLTNATRFKTQMDAARASVAALNDELARGTELAKANADALKVEGDAAKASAAANKTAAATTASAADASTAALDRQAAAQDAVAVSAKTSAARTAEAATVSATAVKKAQEASTKILKLASVGLGLGVYEGIKNYNAFQQAAAQMAIDAGVKANQLGKLKSAALQISGTTGLAGTAVLNMMYRIKSANPHVSMATNQLIAYTRAAANLTIASGTGADPNATSRLYGAIEASGLNLNGGKAKLTPDQINAYALAAAGHGDLYTSDLTAALGASGVLIGAHAYGYNLNDLGAWIDTMSPGMPATKVATLINHGMGMLSGPTAQASAFMSMTGGNELSFSTAKAKNGLFGQLMYLHKLMSTPLSASSAAGYYSKFYGMGLGSFNGGKGGAPTGVIAQLMAMHFTQGQISSAMRGGFVSVPGMEQAVLVKMFGGAKGATPILSLVNSPQTFKNKLTDLTTQETPAAYGAAMKIAYAEPIVKFHMFEEQLKNLTIIIGKDVTPAFDGFLHDLESLGHWFGHNKWALDALGGMAAGVVGGAALIKLAQGASAITHGTASIFHVLAHPIVSVKDMFSTSGKPNYAAFNDATSVFADGASKLAAGATGLTADDARLGLASGGLSADDARLALSGESAFASLSKLATVGMIAYGVYQGGTWLDNKFNNTPVAHALGLGSAQWEGSQNQQKLDKTLAAAVRNPTAWSRAVTQMNVANSVFAKVLPGAAVPMAVPSSLAEIHARYMAELKASADTHKAASQQDQQSSVTVESAAQRQLQAAQLFASKVDQLNTSLSGGPIYGIIKQARQSAIARK